MFAQSDTRSVRQWSMGDKLPHDDLDHWLASVAHPPDLEVAAEVAGRGRPQRPTMD